MKIPYVFDIERASTVDGPGLRTTIFFKGCNLNCFWCHNPEGKSPAPQIAFFREKCISCGVCQAVCPSEKKCTACGICAKNCPTQARRLYGTRYSADELLHIAETDRDFYQATGGGVTFSGGECMLYPEFLTELARKCKQKNIPVAVDTAGNVPYAFFEMILPYVDLFLYDIKCLDSELHRKATGATNERILQNLHRLIAERKEILIRIPNIPGFNEGDEAERIKTYCETYSLPYEILNYHETGRNKYQALQRP